MRGEFILNLLKDDSGRFAENFSKNYKEKCAQKLAVLLSY
jgi:hypothetical protein